MSESLSDRRLAENEVIFRRLNEQVQKGFDEMKKVASEEGQEFLVKSHEDEDLHFYCECSDEKCRNRIILKPRDYNEVHSNENRFIIIPGHELERIERVVIKEPNYYVVEKRESPPDTTDGLNRTSVDNV